MSSERTRFRSRLGTAAVALMIVASGWQAAETADETATALRALDPRVLSRDESLRSMLRDDVRGRLREANRRDRSRWQAVAGRDDWERLRDSRIAALKRSLGRFPPVPEDLRVRTMGTIEKAGCRIEKLVFESRPGLLVTANLYVPGDPPNSMPGILICHSHHNPKTQRELQDMGRTWARQGCLVLVMDQLGHGERRQHPFRTADDHPGEFRPGRQDYYFRYNAGIQLHLVGEGLVGWMAWDLMRGVDLLLSRPGVDPERIILLGAVAGGGDPAAVTAAIDPRIACVVPFNFGGPQPETRYPLPEDAEESFNYSGGGSWESTRNLRLSARDGFLPWVIVGSLAPRRLIYAHEFSWDRERDPVWKRLQTIYGFYEKADHLAFAHGYGLLRGRPPKASHCNNIGLPHRKMIAPSFARWFDVEGPLSEGVQQLPAEDLLCLDGRRAKGLTMTPVHRLADQLAGEQCDGMRRRLAGKSPPEQRKILREAWTELLGDVEPYGVKAESRGNGLTGRVRVERILLHGERDIRLPVLLLVPERFKGAKRHVVVAIAQQSKAGFLKHRAEAVAELLEAGVAVCLPDLRGCGESRPGDGRGRTSEATSISASELMLGQTLVGSRLKDLRSVLLYLRGREFDARRIALWGDSFAPVNPPEKNVAVPLDVEQPHPAEPLGPLLALLGGLFEDDVAAVAANGGLVSLRSALESPFIHLPHDAVVPGATAAGDLPDLAAALHPRPLCIAGLVDGLNRRVSAKEAAAVYASAARVYGSEDFALHVDAFSEARLARWLLDRWVPGAGRASGRADSP